MRRTVAVMAAVVGLALITGCGNEPEHLGGAAAPAGVSEPIVSASPSSSPSAVVSSPSPVKSSAPASSPSTEKSDRLVLGPNGLGVLKLGMSISKAVKTGELVKVGTSSSEGCNAAYRPKAAGSADAPVFFDGAKGIVSFTAYRGLATPEGIKFGSTRAAVKRAYPDFEQITGPDSEDGRGWATVPGNSKAVYNISITDDKVVFFNLQMRDQACYE